MRGGGQTIAQRVGGGRVRHHDVLNLDSCYCKLLLCWGIVR